MTEGPEDSRGLTLKCPLCGERFVLDPDWTDAKGQCPACQGWLAISPDALRVLRERRKRTAQAEKEERARIRRKEKEEAKARKAEERKAAVAAVLAAEKEAWAAPPKAAELPPPPTPPPPPRKPSQRKPAKTQAADSLNLAKCKTCGGKVSRTAPACPHCGEVSPGRHVRRPPSCPSCGSTNVSAQRKGFGIGKAIGGAVLLGPLGLAGGLIGRKKVEMVCAACGRRWEARPSGL